MSNAQPTLGAELQDALRTFLASLEPMIQAAADYVAGADSGPGKCQQTWCVLCALAALADGEPHPLSTLVTAHGTALLGLIRAMVNTDTPEDTTGQANPPRSSSYEPIAVTIVQ